MNCPPAVVIFLYVVKHVDKLVRPAIQKFAQRLEEGGNLATRLATIRSHAAELWTDMGSRSRGSVVRKTHDDFGVDISTLREGEEFGQWLAESWGKEELISPRINLELKVSVKTDGVLSRKAPLHDQCLVRVVCTADRAVYFNVLAIHPTGHGLDVTSLYPDKIHGFPKPDGEPRGRRLEWPDEIDRLLKWEDSGQGTVTFILLAHAKEVSVDEIKAAIPLEAPPELHGAWTDEFEPDDLAPSIPAKPSAYRHFKGAAGREEKAAAEWHRWLAQEVMRRSSAPPLAVAFHSRPFVC